MIGLQCMPHANQNTQASIESYHKALKHWFSLEIKGLKGCWIDWLVWRLTTIAWHYMHKSKMKKREFIKKQGHGMYCENKCGEGKIDPTHTCIPIILWIRWLLDYNESTPCQCGIQNEIPIYKIFKLHMWMGIMRESLQTPNHYYSHGHCYFLKGCHWLL